MSFPNKITKTIKGFKYCSPQTMAEAVSALQEYAGKAMVLAGGTDLLRLMKLRDVTPEYIIDLKNISGLDYIREEKQGLEIGALTRISTICESDLIKPKYFSIYEASKQFGTPQIRNLARLGGNICRSSPAADMAPPLMTFDAEVKLIGPEGERKVLLEEFFAGVGENILNGEILTAIVIPRPEEPYGAVFHKLTRTSVDLAKISCAVRISFRDNVCQDIRIAMGSVARTPVRARKAEHMIIRQSITDEIIEKTARAIDEDIAQITDARSTAEYRRQVSKVLVKRLIKVAVERGKASG